MSASEQELAGGDIDERLRERQEDDRDLTVSGSSDVNVGASASGKLSKNDIVGKFRELQGGVTEVASSKKDSMIQIAGVAGILLIIIVFLLGRRAGRKKTTFVEIRRI